MKLLRWLWIRTFGKRRYQLYCVQRVHDAQLESLKNKDFVFKNANILWKEWCEHTGKFVNGK